MALDLDTALAEYTGRPSAPEFKSAPPEEKEGILRKLAHVGMLPLEALNYVLDIPGRPVRTALAGHGVGDVLSSIVDPSRAVSGQDLATQWGLIDKPRSSDDWLDKLGHGLLGAGLEIGTNPLTYATPAPLTRAGSAAAKAGRFTAPIGTSTADLAAGAAQAEKLAPTFASRVAAGQQKLAGVGLPFGLGDVAQFGGASSPWAMKAAQGATDLGAAIKANPAVAAARGLFQGKFKGAANPIQQEIMERAGDIRAATEPTAAMRVYGVGRELEANAAQAAAEVPLYQQAFGPRGAELFPTQGDIIRGIAEQQLTPLPDSILAKVGLGEKARGIKGGTRYAEEAATGMATPYTEGPYLHRRIGEGFETDPALEDLVTRQGGGETQPLRATQQAQKERALPDRHVIGKTAGLSTMADRPSIGGAIRGGTPADIVRQEIMGDFMQVSPADHALYKQQSLIPDFKRPPDVNAFMTEYEEKLADATTLANRFGNMAQPGRVYGSDPLGDALAREMGGTRAGANAQAVLERLKFAAKPQGSIEGGVALKDVIEKMPGLDLTNAVERAGIDPTMHVPREVAEPIARWVKGHTTPDALHPVLQAFDQLTNMFKVGVSAVWPASRIRDLGNNVWFYSIRGDAPAGNFFGPWKGSFDAFLRGGEIAGAEKIPAVVEALGPNATARAATNWITDQAAARGLIQPHGSTASAQWLNKPLPEARQFTLPGQPFSMREQLAGGSWKPWKVGYGREDAFYGQKAGAAIMDATDRVSRGASFIGRLMKGESVEQAAKSAMISMYDYGNLSPFERGVMQRVFPFYSWMRQNIPAQLEQIVKSPGGALAQSVRATNALRESAGFTPNQLGEGLAIPVGQQSPEGQQAYISHFGLPFEEALGPIHPTSLRETLASTISQMSPLIKAPIEKATGINTYSGKPLGERSGFLDYSPLSRVLSTGRGFATNPLAGALSAVSPLRLSEVNVPGAERQQAREGIAQLLEGNPAVRQHLDINVPKDKRGELSPRDQALLEVLQELNRPQKKK